VSLDDRVLDKLVVDHPGLRIGRAALGAPGKDEMAYWRERFRVSMRLLTKYNGSKAFLGEMSPPRKYKLFPGESTVRRIQ